MILSRTKCICVIPISSTLPLIIRKAFAAVFHYVYTKTPIKKQLERYVLNMTERAL